MRIIFATQNTNKVLEIQSQVGEQFTISSLLDLGHTEELEETQNTLEGNALQKARFVYEKFGETCFADDTGLEVAALGGAPGVYSARYAGEEKSFEKNMDRLLKEMEGKQNRAAHFRTVIALILNGREFLFEGVCKGQILEKRRGKKGFGYDPVFLPEGYNQSFAEMSLEEKTKIGHRGLAVNKLVAFLKEQSESVLLDSKK